MWPRPPGEGGGGGGGGAAGGSGQPALAPALPPAGPRPPCDLMAAQPESCGVSAGARGGVWGGEAVPALLPGQGRAGSAGTTGVGGSRDSRGPSAGHPIRGCGGRVQPLLAKGCGGEGLGLRLLGPAAQETGAVTTEGRRPSLSTCPAGPCWAGVAGQPPSHPPAQAVVPTPPALQNFRRNPDIGRCQAEEELPVAGGGSGERGLCRAGHPGPYDTSSSRLGACPLCPPPHPGAPHPPCSFPSLSCPSGFVAASLPLQGPRLPRPLVPRSPQAISPAQHPGRAGLCRLWAV